MWLQIYYGLILFIGLYTFLFSYSNRRFYRKTSIDSFTHSGPKVSVLIPVRNEEKRIGSCIESLLHQNYLDYEIIILDDSSTDNTWNIITEYAEKNPLLKVISGKKLPSNWNGKNFALQQLAEIANGKYFLFTDADTVHSPNSISYGVTQLQKLSVSLLSGHPRQILPNKKTESVVSAMHFNSIFLIPLHIQYKTLYPLLGLAIGQYIFVDADAYRITGGYNSIQQFVTDDVHIARQFRKHGFFQAFTDLGDIITCNMYSSFTDAVKGISRSIVDFFDGKLLIPFILLFLIIAFITLPPFLIIYQLIFSIHQVSITAIFGIIFLQFAWFKTMRFHHYSKFTSICYLFTLFLIISMFLYGIVKIITKKGFEWKGRIVQ